jgi:hypothetical protein
LLPSCLALMMPCFDDTLLRWCLSSMMPCFNDALLQWCLALIHFLLF